MASTNVQRIMNQPTAAAIQFEVRGGEWQDAYMQMDREIWKQPMQKEYSTFVEIKRVPFQSLMVRGE